MCELLYNLRVVRTSIYYHLLRNAVKPSHMFREPRVIAQGRVLREEGEYGLAERAVSSMRHGGGW